MAKPAVPTGNDIPYAAEMSKMIGALPLWRENIRGVGPHDHIWDSGRFMGETAHGPVLLTSTIWAVGMTVRALAPKGVVLGSPFQQVGTVSVAIIENNLTPETAAKFLDEVQSALSPVLLGGDLPKPSLSVCDLLREVLAVEPAETSRDGVLEQLSKTAGLVTGQVIEHSPISVITDVIAMARGQLDRTDLMALVEKCSLTVDALLESHGADSRALLADADPGKRFMRNQALRGLATCRLASEQLHRAVATLSLNEETAPVLGPRS
jgi:hypothetical protein